MSEAFEHGGKPYIGNVGSGPDGAGSWVYVIPDGHMPARAVLEAATVFYRDLMAARDRAEDA